MMPESLRGKKIRVVGLERNPLIMSDARLEALGLEYRTICNIHGTHLLWRNGKIVTFEQYVLDRQASDAIMKEVSYGTRSGKKEEGRAVLS